ncbi:MAG: fused MFS/spermidine synthase [Bacteroidetes bacterium]|nr:fused MFS/spermidine synthase [Bacteroidota bacterium]
MNIKIKKESGFIYAVIALGFSSVIAQIIYIREFLNVFYGNELIFGLILSSWMVLTATGAYLGKYSSKIKKQERYLIILQIFSAFFPLVTVFLLRWFRYVIFPVGSMLSIPNGIFLSLTFLAPYCIISGFLFTYFSIALSKMLNSNQISRVYYFDTVGSIIGGFVFNFILIYFLNGLQSLYILLFINLSAGLIISLINHRRKAIILIIILFSGFLVLTFSFNLEKYTKEKQFKNQELIYYKDTPYGNLVLTRTGEQLNFFENSMLLFSTENISDNEEAVHYAMLQHSNPEKVLLISGGVNGLAKEILKYPVDSIDYLEINPVLVELGKKYTKNLERPKIKIKYEDARFFIKRTTEKYDVVIIALPEPTTAQLNRFYTLEFFTELKKKLNNNGVISFALLSTAEYISPEVRNINSVMYNTLNKVFRNIIIIQGGKNYFIASDASLNANITELVEKRGIENIYVNKYYLNDSNIKVKMNTILKFIDKNSDINLDFHPVVYYHQLRYWMSHFKTNYYFLFGIFFLLLLVFLVRLNPVNLCMFTNGFAASSIEVILLITFQIIYGYVYQMIGVIIMLFMAGLALGSLYINKKAKIYSVIKFLKIQTGIVIYSFVLPFILIILNLLGKNPYIIEAAFIFLILVIGILTGMGYSLTSKISKKDISSIAAETYGADLFGSAIGALLLSAFLLPLLGIFEVCFLTGLINIFSGIILFAKRKNYLN